MTTHACLRPIANPLARFALLALLAVLVLCGPAVAQAHALEMMVGQQYDAATSGATYKSNKAKVASVNKSGTIKAKKAGKAKVTITTASKKKTVSVTVYAKASSKAKKPSTPSNPLAKQSGTTKAKLSWKKVSGATGYVVYQKISGKYVAVQMVKGATKTSTTIKNLKAGSTQYFYVSAYKKVKQGKSTKLALSKASLKVSTLLATASSTKADATSVKFARNQVTIVGNGSGEALASVATTSGKKLTSSSIRYTVNNSAAASVSADGVIASKTTTATTCKVTAWAHNGKHKSITVNIVPSLSASATTWIAHRGEQALAPENTLAAFSLAAAEGYNTVEFDVWETYSGDLVISHNQTLNKMCGVNVDVRELTADPTSEYYVGNYKITGGNNVEKFGTQYVLTFKDVVRFCSALGLDMKIHVKNTESDPISEEGMTQLAQTLTQYNCTSKATVASHLMPTLKLAQTCGIASTQLSLTSNSGYGVQNKDTYTSELKRAADDAKAAGITAISIPWHSDYPLDMDTVSYIRAQGVQTSAWTIESAKTACRLIDIGIDGITCNKKLFG